MVEPDVRWLQASDGMQLHFRHWSAASSAKGIVVALHGIQSHSGWYDFSSRKMAEAGFHVYFADRRGAGLNGRPRGHADHGVRLLNDVRQLIRLARREYPDLPITLSGLSWGGKTAMAFAATYPTLIERLILLYPGLEPRIRPNVWQRFRLSFARRHDVRHHPVTIPLRDPALFTHDTDSQQFITTDPLALEHITSGFLNAGLDLENLLHKNRSAVTHPTLLMLAGNDQIIDNEGTKQLLTTFPIRQLTSNLYPDAAHTLEFGLQRDAFAADMVSWLGN